MLLGKNVGLEKVSPGCLSAVVSIQYNGKRNIKVMAIPITPKYADFFLSLSRDVYKRQVRIILFWKYPVCDNVTIGFRMYQEAFIIIQYF